MAKTITRTPKRQKAEPVWVETSRGDVNVRLAVQEAIRLPALREQYRESFTTPWKTARVCIPPGLTIRRRSDDSYSGHASAGGRVVLSIGQNQLRGEVDMLVLHELAHYVCPVKEQHGKLWRWVYRRAVAQAFPGIELLPADDPSTRQVYKQLDGSGLDGMIIAAIEAWYEKHTPKEGQDG